MKATEWATSNERNSITRAASPLGFLRLHTPHHSAEISRVGCPLAQYRTNDEESRGHESQDTMVLRL